MEQVVEQVMDLISPALNKAVEVSCAFVTAAGKKLWQLCGAAVEKVSESLGEKMPEEARKALRIVMCAASTVAVVSGVLFFLSRGKKR